MIRCHRCGLECTAVLIDSHLTQCRFRAYKEEQTIQQKPKKDVAWGLTYGAYERAR